MKGGKVQQRKCVKVLACYNTFVFEDLKWPVVRKIKLASYESPKEKKVNGVHIHPQSGKAATKEKERLSERSRSLSNMFT